LKTDSILT